MVLLIVYEVKILSIFSIIVNVVKNLIIICLF